MIIAIVSFIILLMVLVLVHEFGHFILARKAGVTVHEFSIGMGPKVLSFGKDKKGTHFVLRLFPIGGYVRIKGESPSEAGALTQNDSFLRASFLWKVAILLGGVTMNILTAWIIFTVGFMHGVKPIQVLPDNVMLMQSQSYLMPSYSFLKDKGLVSGDATGDVVKITSLVEDGLAKQMGLQAGDTIVSLNAIAVTTQNLQEELQHTIGREVVLLYERNGEEKTATAVCPADSCLLGVLLSTQTKITIAPAQFPLFQAMGAAINEMREQSRLTFNALATVITKIAAPKGGKGGLENLSGPVGAAKVGQFVLASGGWIQFILFGGMLSMALAIFNLLPIPALDGGRLFGVTVQRLFRLHEEKYFIIEGRVNTVFFLALLILGVYIMAQDLIKIWGVTIPGLG